MIGRYTWPGCLPDAYVPMGPPALAGQSASAVGAGNVEDDCAEEKPPQLSHVPRLFATSFDDEVTD